MNTERLARFLTTLIAVLTFSVPAANSAVKVDESDFKAVESIEKVVEYVSEKVKPAVVNISTVSTIRIKHPPIPPEFREFFRGFGFPFPEFPDEYKTRSLGSGFIVKVKDGWAYILTNNHVVSKADKIKVKLSNGKTFNAKVVGKDPKTDVAVIKIKVGDEKVSTVELGDSNRIKVGDFVIAIGNPYGLNWTVTHGIISAKGRHGLGINPIENFIQTDAAINPGNSGGPLCDIHGKVIGINAAIVRNAQGLGFAVPINIAKKVMDDILRYGKVIRGWLGVYIQDLTPELEEKFSIKHGVLVTKVMKGGPADRAGIRSGDIIVSFNGKPVKSVSSLQLMVINSKPGETVSIEVIRDGRRKTFKVKIGSMEGEVNVAELVSKYGFSVQNLTKDLKEKLGIPKKVKGLLITEVKPGSPADDAGLSDGDIILKAGTVPRNMVQVKDKDDLLKVVRKAGRRGLLLKVLRGEAIFYAVLKPET